MTIINEDKEILELSYREQLEYYEMIRQREEYLALQEEYDERYAEYYEQYDVV